MDTINLQPLADSNSTVLNFTADLTRMATEVPAHGTISWPVVFTLGAFIGFAIGCIIVANNYQNPDRERSSNKEALFIIASSIVVVIALGTSYNIYQGLHRSETKIVHNQDAVAEIDESQQPAISKHFTPEEPIVSPGSLREYDLSHGYLSYGAVVESIREADPGITVSTEAISGQSRPKSPNDKQNHRLPITTMDSQDRKPQLLNVDVHPGRAGNSEHAETALTEYRGCMVKVTSVDKDKLTASFQVMCPTDQAQSKTLKPLQAPES